MEVKLPARWDQGVRHDIRRRQGAQLRNFLFQCVGPFSAYYRAMFKKIGLTEKRFKSIDDLRHIPFTSKVDLLSSPEHPKRARDFILMPDEAVLARRPSVILQALLHGKKNAKAALEREYRPIFMTSTTGRSAEPTPFLYTQQDIENLQRAGQRLVEIIQAKPDYKILNLFPFAPHLAFWLAHYAATSSNVFCLSSGGGKVMGTQGNIALIEKIRPNALIGMPTFIYHVLQQAASAG